MLENFWREIWEILKKLRLFLENFRIHEKFLENQSNSFNDFIGFLKFK